MKNIILFIVFSFLSQAQAELREMQGQGESQAYCSPATDACYERTKRSARDIVDTHFKRTCEWSGVGEIVEGSHDYSSSCLPSRGKGWLKCVVLGTALCSIR